MAKRFSDEHSRIHISYKENKSLTGTARYASRNAHNFIEQSRRDDLESIGYLLVYLIRGKLPWQGLKCKDKDEKYRRIKEMKNSIDPFNLCEGLPIEFGRYLDYCYKLKFDEDPNYKYLIELFSDLYKAKDYENDYLYDWITVVMLILFYFLEK